jgi:hypothetical protein
VTVKDVLPPVRVAVIEALLVMVCCGFTRTRLATLPATWIKAICVPSPEIMGEVVTAPAPVL